MHRSLYRVAYVIFSATLELEDVFITHSYKHAVTEYHKLCKHYASEVSDAELQIEDLYTGKILQTIRVCDLTA